MTQINQNAQNAPVVKKTINCSNGVKCKQEGDTIFCNNDKTYTQTSKGDWTSNDGTKYLLRGGSVFGTDGTVHHDIFNKRVFPGETKCLVY